MNKKWIASVLAALTALTVLAACGAPSAGSASPDPAPTRFANASSFYGQKFAYENGAIRDLKASCDQQGTVVSLEYETPAYAVNDLLGLSEVLRKKLNIYLPYGYDENKPCNVLYLLHGTKGAIDGPMEDYWLIQWGDQTRNVLDNMIKNGLCEPLIVVTPSYYSEVEGHPLGRAEAEALAKRLQNSHVAEEGEGDELAQNIWPNYFDQELRSNIIPAVESQYLTYAGKDISEESLIATRDHRALAGLSRGAMAVACSGLTSNADIFAWFGSFSGAWQEFDSFKEAMEGKFKDYSIKFWFNGNGKNDFALNNHRGFCEKALTEMPDKFIDGENYAFVTLNDGDHVYASWIVDLYNSLLVFF